MSKPSPHKKVIVIAGVVVAVMFTFCFAMVPLYSVICRATGISTSVRAEDFKAGDSANGEAIDKTRDIEIQFVAVNNKGMPWDFYPKTKTVKVHPGQNNKVFFYAKNTTDHDMTVQAIPSMTPTEAISHFHKIECFCFTKQTLKSHQSRDMPLIFYVDNDLPKDTRVITLAYTLFDMTPQETKKG